MYLSKRKGIYYLYYPQHNGKTTSITTKTKFKSEALKFLTNFETQRKKEPKNKIYFYDLVFQFLKHSESLHKWNTTRTYKSTLGMAKEYFGNIPISKFTIQNLQDYFDYRATLVTAHVRRRDIITFSNIFNYAIAHKYMTENIIRNIKKVRIPEKQPLYFSSDEFNQFILSIDNQDFKDLVVLAVNTGLRQMELLTLTKEQIDLSKGILTLDNRTHITKTSKIRVIPLNEKAKEVLSKRIALDVIFPFTQTQTINRFQKYRKISGIRTELTFHSLRHTFASWLVQKGVPIFNVSKLLGHSDIKTTQIYAHVSNNELLSSVETINY